MNIKNRLNGHLHKKQDGVTGIQQAIVAKKAMKRMEKINMLADGVAMGEIKSKIFRLED